MPAESPPGHRLTTWKRCPQILRRLAGRCGPRQSPALRRASAWAFVLYVALLGVLAVPGAQAEFQSGEVRGLSWLHGYPTHAVPVGSAFFVHAAVAPDSTPTDSVRWLNLTVEGECTLLNETLTVDDGAFASWLAEIRMEGDHCRWHRAAEGLSGGLTGGEVESRVDVAGNVVSFTMHDIGQDPSDGAWGRWFAVAVGLGLFMFGALVGAWFVMGFGAAALVGQLFLLDAFWFTPEVALLLGAIGIALEAYASDRGKATGEDNI